MFYICTKSNEITFPMQLVSCQYSSKINRNHRNNILTVTTGNDDVIIHVATMVGCYAIDGLIPPHSPKMGLTNLKTKVCGTVSNIDTIFHVCAAHGSQGDLGRQGSRVGSRWEGGWAGRAHAGDGASVCGGRSQW
jgi:hypothetical protein